MKKNLLAILAAVTVLGLAGCQGSTQTDAGAFEYEELDDETIKITGLKDGSLKAIVIPEKIDGKKVTEIGIGAISGCSSLTRVGIPEGVTEIGEGAFAGCSSLSEIAVDKKNPTYTSVDGVLFDKEIKTILAVPGKKQTYRIPEGVTEIGIGAFAGCSSLTRVEIPESVTEIGYGAFLKCSSLTSVVIPEGVTEIDAAFSGCSSLTRVEIPGSVTEIKGYAFEGCSSLTRVEIPGSVTLIWTSAFAGCSSLNTIIAPAGSYAESWAKENGYNVQH
ncbi:MAG: leucine-rich repeat protein [Lachnospiraceae bacterium]|nr:leucine-rich repeat protein [Lachnospiraceae bacterium]